MNSTIIPIINAQCADPGWSAATARARKVGEASIETARPQEPVLRLEGITKTFGTFRAIDDLSLDIAEGEVFALLGPSGCGKSTTLRQIAGLDQPDMGRIVLRDRVLFSAEDDSYVPAQDRNMGMVFQSYAIWPHLSIFETVAYPLRLRKVARSEIDRLVVQILDQVGLGGMEDRAPATLSGGQQQRVALARALVYQPDVLLLDEPFSNLDVKLREQMRFELKSLQRQVAVTVILVTHDQSEALSLADRVGVMNEGRIEQVGTPQQLYESPLTPFVRDFIGQTARIQVTLGAMEEGGPIRVALGDGSVEMLSTCSRLEQPAIGLRAVACVRPESIRVGSAVNGAGENVAEAVIETLLYLGDHYECVLSLAGERILAYVPRAEHLREGSSIRMQIPAGELALWHS